MNIELFYTPGRVMFDSGSPRYGFSQAQRTFPNTCKINLIRMTPISSLYFIMKSFNGARRMDNKPVAFNYMVWDMDVE
jgi:hypothetical protein